MSEQLIQEPMLAAPLLKPSVEHTDENILQALSCLKYPVLATVKMDGIRAINLGDLASRTFKKIPNESLREYAKTYIPYGFDMELWSPELRYDQIESIVMSRVHVDSDKIKFNVLDWWSPQKESQSYCVRLGYIRSFVLAHNLTRIIFQEPIVCNNSKELFLFFLSTEQQDGEGICFRALHGPYKQGRSTLKEQYLVKLARYVRSEVTIIGFVEQQANVNADQKNFVGKMKRSTAGSGFGKGILGAFIVRDDNGLEFTVGTGVGLTNDLRAKIWCSQSQYIGKRITIKHKPHGAKVKPRSPVWCGFREKGV